MKSYDVLLKLIRGVSGGGSGSGSGGGSGAGTDIPETEPERTVWIDFESNNRTIINSAFYKTKDMEILGQTTQSDDAINTDFIHAGVYDSATQLYKITMQSGSTKKNIYIPQELIYNNFLGVSSNITVPQERLYLDTSDSKYYIDKYYERLTIDGSNAEYVKDRTNESSICFKVTAFTQTYITENKYLVDHNNTTAVCGNYSWLQPGNLTTIYNTASTTEGVFLGYNVLLVRVLKTRITDMGYTIDATGITSWLNKLKSDGKPIILYLPKQEVEKVVVSGISDLNIVTYEGENTLQISNGNGILKCKYPTK